MVKRAHSPDGIELHGPADFQGMRVAGKLAAEVLDMITPHVVPGAITGKLDKTIEDYVNASGAVSATIGYKGYKHASCISINQVVCHGIPAMDKKLAEGDIVNIDVTVIVDGWYGDTSRTFLVGEKIKPLARKLVDTTYECMMRGIAAVKPGNTLGDVGHAIQILAEANHFSVVRDFCGHGLGRQFHEPPSVLHLGRPGEGVILEPGMFFTIEPMINAGHYATKVLPDGWTAVTRDRSLSAQFEHSIGVTETGYEIFTLSPKGYTKPPY
jgi:methionyl aminopeptidase